MSTASRDVPLAHRGPDPLRVARLERTALTVAVILIGGGAVVGGWLAAAGVLGGALMSAGSYRALSAGVQALGRSAGSASASVPASSSPAPQREPSLAPSLTRVTLGLVGRHALLLAVGYVIIARLRLPPLAVLVGASAVVIAAAVEAVRSAR